MPIVVQPPAPQLRIQGRSYMAFVLVPEPPLPAWLATLDAHIARAKNFFQGRAVVLDASGLSPEEPGWSHLMSDLRARGVRLVDVDGAQAPLPGAEAFGTALVGGRTVPLAAQAEPQAPPPPAETALVLHEPIRSGQRVSFTDGDVTVVGSVASGAEVVAGGSIHVYGTLRGRALAGATGNARACVFCSKLQAELISIDGFYLLAEAMEPALRGRAVQARLDGQSIVMAALD
jgi:septum site-determining protein MinC